MPGHPPHHPDPAPGDEGCDTFRAINPANGQPLDPAYRDATVAEIDAVMTRAAEAFDAYRHTESERRAVFLETIAQRIMDLGDALLERTGRETGLPRARLENERGRTMAQLRMFAEVLREGSWIDARIDRAMADRQPFARPDLRRMLIPLGPVVVFGASNFPYAYSTAGGDTASALAAGCPVVHKAHPAHPGTCAMIAQAIAEAASDTAMPAGVFGMVHGRRHPVGLALVRHPAARAVGFTGSLAGGRALCDAAAQRPDPIPVYAEMGSTNPVFLLPGALQARADELAAALHQSVTLGVGQFCTKPGLILAPQGEAFDRFLQALAARFRATAPATMLHQGILGGYDEAVQRLSGVRGVRILATSEAQADVNQTQARACLFTTDAATLLQHAEVGGEIFGPAAVVVEAAAAEQFQPIARQLAGHLTATVHGTDEDLLAHRQLIAILETRVGRLVFNGVPTGVEVCASMQHGGPYPASSDSRSTSVGSGAIARFARAICYQNCPPVLLPPALRDDAVR